MTTDHDCSCGSCTTADLQADPFLALRARQGMLLGEDDFRVLMGNPRGKLMLHNAWLHGTGVVWGYGVRRSGDWHLEIRPGLAVDGLGRELASTTTVMLDLRDWVTENWQPPEGWDGCSPFRQETCLVVEFRCTTADPRPTLADPCEVSRGLDADSRILEEAQITVVPGKCEPCRRCRRDHRLRVLFGLDPAEPRDRAAREASQALEDVASRPRHERVEAFCHHLHCLEAHDAGDIRPPCAEGTDRPTMLPVTEEQAAVVLACVVVEVSGEAKCPDVTICDVDDCCRCVLLPTQTITEMLCAIAARVLRPGHYRHHDHDHDGHDRDDDESGDYGHPWPEHDDHTDWGATDLEEGPRVHADDVFWDDDARSYLVPVSAHLVAGSVRRAVMVTSLSARGWIEEDVESVRYDPENTRIVVRMAARPQNSVVRLVVRGTGPTPVYGVSPAAPLAGVHGGPPAGRHDGRDAVITVTDGAREAS